MYLKEAVCLKAKGMSNTRLRMGVTHALGLGGQGPGWLDCPGGCHSVSVLISELGSHSKSVLKITKIKQIYTYTDERHAWTSDENMTRI